MITVEHLTKYYGDNLAVDDLSFKIEAGHVYGFLGPNGAGKSTTMNIMTGCLSANEGKAVIDGCDILEDPIGAKRKIGYLPEMPPLYQNETVEEYLNFVAEAKGLKKDEKKQKVDEAMKKTGADPVRDKLISSLSKGYRQRVGIAQALLGSPEVIVLDEPTVGLDPIQIIEIRDLIRQLGKEHTVIFSSHILSEVQAICDKVMIISKGKLIAFDDTDKLENHLLSKDSIELKVETKEKDVKELMKTYQDLIDECTYEKKRDNTYLISIRIKNTESAEFSRKMFSFFAGKDQPIIEMNSNKASLEDVFIELTEADQKEYIDYLEIEEGE